MQCRLQLGRKLGLINKETKPKLMSMMTTTAVIDIKLAVVVVVVVFALIVNSSGNENACSQREK